MTRFETLEGGQQLGVTFFGGKDLGKVKFLTESELSTLWSLDEDEVVVSDNFWEGTVSDLKDLLFSLEQCSEEEMVKRGRGDRLESGLHLQTCVSGEGKLFLRR